MSQNNQIKPEFLSDPAPLSSDEQAYLRTLLSEEDLEKCYEGHCEAAHRKLWAYFQVKLLLSFIQDYAYISQPLLIGRKHYDWILFYLDVEFRGVPRVLGQ